MSLLNNVDRSQSDAMNLQVLRRQDDRIMEIVGMASHVVMYEFDQTNQNWVSVVSLFVNFCRLIIN
jgi:hypothetical protein